MSELNRREFLAATAASAARVPGANDRIRVAVIGCGDRGLLGEVLQVQADTNVQVAAICDTWRLQREKAAEAVRKAGGDAPEQFVHYGDVLASSRIDAVVIGTPDHQHCTMLRDAVRAGKDVYVEKPLAMNMRELLDAVDTVNKSDRVVQMGTQVRSWAAPVAARQFVASGALGSIFKIEQSRNSYRPYWHRLGERAASLREEDVDWKAFLMNVPGRPFDADQYAAWYGYREFSRGPQTNLMVHFIDLVHYVMASKPPRSVMAMGGIYRWKDKRTAPDSVEVLFDYDGFLVRYTSVFGTSDNSYLKFFGTHGVMDATRWDKPWVLRGEPGDKERIPDGMTIPAAESTHHMKNWLECVRSRKTPAAPIDAGYAHAVAVLMADESLVRGVRMVHDPVKRRIHPA